MVMCLYFAQFCGIEQLMPLHDDTLYIYVSSSDSKSVINVGSSFMTEMSTKQNNSIQYGVLITISYKTECIINLVVWCSSAQMIVLS